MGGRPYVPFRYRYEMANPELSRCRPGMDGVQV